MGGHEKPEPCTKPIKDSHHHRKQVNVTGMTSVGGYVYSYFPFPLLWSSGNCMRLKQLDLIIWGRCWKNDKGEGIFRIRRQSSIGRVDCVMSNCRKEMHLSILILSRRANIRQTTSNTFCCFEEKVHRQEKKEKVYYPPSFPVLPVCVLSSRCASDVSEVEED